MTEDKVYDISQDFSKFGTGIFKQKWYVYKHKHSIFQDVKLKKRDILNQDVLFNSPKLRIQCMEVKISDSFSKLCRQSGNRLHALYLASGYWIEMQTTISSFGCLLNFMPYLPVLETKYIHWSNGFQNNLCRQSTAAVLIQFSYKAQSWIELASLSGTARPEPLQNQRSPCLENTIPIQVQSQWTVHCCPLSCISWK